MRDSAKQDGGQRRTRADGERTRSAILRAVTVAFLVAVGAAESGRPTLMFQAKEAVRLTLDGVAAGVACDGCPALGDLLARYEKAGGRFMVCPICFNAKQLDQGSLLPNAELAGTVQLWEWIGDDGATTFSY